MEALVVPCNFAPKSGSSPTWPPCKKAGPEPTSSPPYEFTANPFVRPGVHVQMAAVYIPAKGKSDGEDGSDGGIGGGDKVDEGDGGIEDGGDAGSDGGGGGGGGGARVGVSLH